MSLQDLTQAAAAQNALTARINAFFDQLETDRDDYAALAADLKGEVGAALNKTLYIDYLAGNDANAGTQAAPLKTINAASTKVLPGARVTLNLAMGQDHPAQGAFFNNYIVMQGYGAAAPISLTTTSGVAGGISLAHCGLRLNSIGLRTGLSQGGVAPSPIFPFARWAHISSLGGPIEIGDADILTSTNDRGFPSFTAYHTPITRTAGSAGSAKLMAVSNGLFSMGGSASVPAGSTITDFLTIVRNADGDAVNILSNVVL